MESGIIRQKAAEQTDPTIQSKPIKRHQRSCEAVNGLNESRLNFRLDVLSLLLFGRSQNFQESKGTPSQSSFGSRPRRVSLWWIIYPSLTEVSTAVIQSLAAHRPSFFPRKSISKPWFWTLCLFIGCNWSVGFKSASSSPWLHSDCIRSS
ncbi:hypothetical protein ASPTUDRAFT_575088 [Aspergillus tubingensis CBS 134.48]|uniref:Uncharacterized protein n=1 Tax=Aspergillus tubingensis (strain CBS 134.48) TaxID=767770 RepID=A0A1L9N7U0_ASPTC|nr:hypothetical protein ASPTUDRAFT_575088 [Aspergillus tubingensis CBS 134.48]